jgi:hypothetical protein
VESLRVLREIGLDWDNGDRTLFCSAKIINE